VDIEENCAGFDASTKMKFLYFAHPGGKNAFLTGTEMTNIKVEQFSLPE
jgi:hypothetical protein